MSRVLLTGGNGFVGRQIDAALRAAGHEVIGVVRSGFNALHPATVRLETANLFDESDDVLQEMASRADIVVHAAWYAEAGKYQNSPINLDCLAGTVRLARAAMEVGVRRFVGVGTCYEYDFAAIGPAGSAPIAPDAPLGPDTVYGAAKAATYLSLSRAMALSDTSFAWCRLFYLYGDGEDPRRLLPYVLEKLKVGKAAELSAGTQIRDFLDIAEAGRQIARVAESSETGPINICSGRAISVKDFLLSQIPTDADRSLLHFGAREMRVDEPPWVVGRPGGLSTESWKGQK